MEQQEGSDQRQDRNKFENTLSLGEAQSPRLDQYADQIDTIEFPTQLQ